MINYTVIVDVNRFVKGKMIPIDLQIYKQLVEVTGLSE